MDRLRIGLLQLREDHEVADHELGCFRKIGGLDEDEVVALRSSAGLERLAAEWRSLDGLIVGGSKLSVGGTDRAWVRLRELLPGIVGDTSGSALPYFGSCFGYQALAVALGGVASRRPERKEIGTRRLQLTAQGRDDPVFSVLPERFTAQAGHHDSVVTLPPGAVCMAEGEVPLQAARFGHLVYGTQFHVELTERTVRERMERYRDADFGADGAGYETAVAALRPSPAPGRLLRRFLELVRDRDAR